MRILSLSIKGLRLFFIVGFLFFGFSSTASASAIYTENFSGPAGTHLEDHETNWIRNEGNEYIDLNGDNTASIVGEAHYWWNSTQTIDQYVQFDFKANTTLGRNYYGIIFNEFGYGCGCSNDQVYIEIYSDLSGKIYNTNFNEFYSFPPGYFTEGQWYTIKARYDANDDITVYFNGTLVAQWHSQYILTDSGSFGINVENGSIRNLIYGDGQEQTIGNLINIVQQMNLQQGIQNSLDAKLEAAQEALNAANSGQQATAVSKLNAFINQVEGQRGNQLSNAQADELITYAQNLINIIQGN